MPTSFKTPIKYLFCFGLGSLLVFAIERKEIEITICPGVCPVLRYTIFSRLNKVFIQVRETSWLYKHPISSLISGKAKPHQPQK